MPLIDELSLDVPDSTKSNFTREVYVIHGNGVVFGVYDDFEDAQSIAYEANATKFRPGMDLRPVVVQKFSLNQSVLISMIDQYPKVQQAEWQHRLPRVGDYAMFVNRNGHDHEREHAAKALGESIKAHKVIWVEIGSWHSEIALEGIEGTFNSVMFLYKSSNNSDYN